MSKIRETVVGYGLNDSQVRFLEFRGAKVPRSKVLRRRTYLNMQSRGGARFFDRLCAMTGWYDDDIHERIGILITTGICPERDTYEKEDFKCHSCGKTVPLADGVLYPIDSRCDACIAEHVATYGKQEALKFAEKTQLAHKLAKAIDGDERIAEAGTDLQIPRHVELLALTVENQGGWISFCEKLAEGLRSASGKQALDFGLNVLKMIENYEKQDKITLDIEGLTPEQVDSVIVNALLSEYYKRTTHREGIVALLRERNVTPNDVVPAEESA